LNQRLIQFRGKGGKERIVALVPILAKALENQKNISHPGPYVFGHEPLHTRKAFEWVRTWGRRAGLLKSLNPHALRHSFATHMLSGGTDLRVLQELLGHESLAATQKYLHLNMEQLTQTMEDAHPLSKSSGAKSVATKSGRK
jgi:integrase/recombinase XerC/integrase/recombinase XerD